MTTKAELVTAIAEKSGLNKNQAKDALEAFTAAVTESLKAGNEVRLVGFGSFLPVSRAAGMARNPRTGEAVPVESRGVPAFKPSKEMRQSVEASRRD